MRINITTSPYLRAALAAILSGAAAQAVFAQETPVEGELDEIVVTGSRIRGAAPVGSSVVGLERTDIEAAAGVTVDRIIREQPMVFDLGVSETSRNQSG